MASALRDAVSGLLLLDKPAGFSSTAALGRAKYLLNAAKAGHTGTLDPFATGLLPLAFGEATKFSRFALDADKGYLATVQLGVATSTGDPEGEVLARQPVLVTATDVELALAGFLGPQTQIPPMHSALKQGGVPLYALARQGMAVERAPRSVVLHTLKVQHWHGHDCFDLEVRCSKGTYIRVLAEDLGARLGCGAHLSALRRSHSGSLSLAQAVTLDALEAMGPSQRLGMLLPVDALVRDLPSVDLDQAQMRALCEGRTARLAQDRCGALASGAEVAIYGPDGAFRGVGRFTRDREGCTVVPVRLVNTEGLLA